MISTVSASVGRYAVWMELLGWVAILLFILTIPAVYSAITGSQVPFTYFQRNHLMFAGIWSALILGMLWGKGWLLRVFESFPLVYLGKISYSLYVWHLAIVVPVYWSVSVPLYIKGWAALTGVIAVASVSYFFLERPILRWSASLGKRGQPGHLPRNIVD